MDQISPQDLSAPNLSAWKVRRQKLLLERPPYLAVYLEEIELPDGRIVPEFLQVKANDFVVIVVRDDAGRYLFQKQYKHGPKRVSLTLTAGAIDKGETPLAAAQRELLEETGCVAAHWQSLGEYCTMGNLGGSQCHLFIADGAIAQQKPQSGDLEETEILWLTEQETIEAYRAKEMVILPFVAALGLVLGPKLWSQV